MNNSMDIIITLIGLNSIPNYATILNYCKKDSKVILVYTDDYITNSEKLANNLKTLILNRFETVNIRMKVSSKSDFKNIVKTFTEISEEIMKEVENNGKDFTNILLDITGSTKPNSALALSILKDYLTLNNKVRFYESYVSNEEERIYQDGYNRAVYDLEELAGETDITKEEILDLYGYEDYVKVNSNLKIIDYIVLQNFNLIFCVNSKATTFNKLKEEMFITIDVAEKLGGNSSKIFLKASSFINTGKKHIEDEEMAQENFIKMFENNTNKTLENRIILKSLNDGFCNNKDIEELIEEEF